MKITDIARAVDVGLTVLTHRLLTLLALLMTFALSCWAMSEPTWLHFLTSGAFGVLIFLPVLYCDRRPEAKWQSQNEPT